MITAYSLTDSIPEIISPGSGTRAQWVHAVAPSLEECREISAQYAIPMEYLQAPLDFNERPRVEHDGQIMMILVRTALSDADHGPLRFRTCPVAVILTPDRLVTVCPRPDVVELLVCRKLKGKGGDPVKRLALSLLFFMGTNFIDHLRRMDEHVGFIEKTLYKSMQNKELIDMLHMEKSLIYFVTALKGNQAVLEKLAQATPVFHDSDDLELLDDVLIENKQAADMSEIFSQVIGSISSAFGSIVSNNLNKVMKFLTGITLVFMIPSMVGALYGMNVALPFAESPYAFTVLMIVSVVLALAFWALFWKKDWL